MYFVMEWLDGESLSCRLERQGTLPLLEAARLLVPCLRGMHEAHLANVVHSELRPGNVFICRGRGAQPESLHLFDFALARRNFEPPRAARFDWLRGRYERHASYLAPEQITGATVDRRADVYAFGVMLYEALAGRPPFAPERQDEFARWIYAQEPPALPRAPGMSPRAYQVLHRALARNAEQRFQSCQELANALDALVRQPLMPDERAVAPGHRAAARQTSPASAGPAAVVVDGSLLLEAANTIDVTDSARLDATRPPPLPGRQPVPVPHAAQRPYRRPVDARLWLAGACVAVLGVFPLVAYYAPAVDGHDDAAEDRFVAPAATTQTVVSGARRADPPPTAAVPPARTAAKPALSPKDLVDDPRTPIDESDPLIAAALASVRGAPPSAEEPAERAVVLPKSAAAAAPVPAAVSGKAAAAVQAPPAAAPAVKDSPSASAVPLHVGPSALGHYAAPRAASSGYEWERVPAASPRRVPPASPSPAAKRPVTREALDKMDLF